METRNQAKARRRKNFCSLSYQAEIEGSAIAHKIAIGVVRTPRLRYTYTVDGEVFLTGQKHRCANGSSTGLQEPRKPKHGPMRSTKQRNLISENVHKRIDNPVLFKKGKSVNLLEYWKQIKN